MKPIRLSNIDEERFLQRAKQVPAEVSEVAWRIIEEIRTGGDMALAELTEQLDGVRLASPWLDEATWDALAVQCPADVRAAIDGNLARIHAFHARQAGSEDRFDVTPGVTLGRRPVAYRSVACYVPGGRASYPSTVLMTVAPATIAGVADIIVVTPPRKDGSIDAAVAYAARSAGASRILLAGGAQAIAAVVLGTESIEPVASVVGPGNAYVTAAKQILSDRVRIDSPAGPSELLVLADKSADAGHVALDMMAQAEHDPDAQVILVTDDAALADDVAAALERRVPSAARKDIIEASLAAHGAILLADDWDRAVAFADAYAAEHLEIISQDPHADLARIRDAGSVFLGPWAPVSLGDYGSGTNHVLPTMGFARLTGGLSVDNFRKWITWQEVSKAGLAAIAADVTTMAKAEGLHAHAEAVRGRL